MGFAVEKKDKVPMKDPRHYTFVETMERDFQLNQLASYDVTKGLVLICKTSEEELALRKTIVERFNYFKRGIQTGEYTLAQLKDHILSKYGAYKQKATTTEEEIAALEKISYLPLTPDDESDVEERDDHRSLGFFDALSQILPPFPEMPEYEGSGPIALKDVEDVLRKIRDKDNKSKKPKKPIGDPFGVLGHEEDETLDEDQPEQYIPPEDLDEPIDPPEENEPPEVDPDIKLGDDDDDDFPF